MKMPRNCWFGLFFLVCISGWRQFANRVESVWKALRCRRERELGKNVMCNLIICMCWTHWVVRSSTSLLFTLQIFANIAFAWWARDWFTGARVSELRFFFSNKKKQQNNSTHTRRMSRNEINLLCQPNPVHNLVQWAPGGSYILYGARWHGRAYQYPQWMFAS